MALLLVSDLHYALRQYDWLASRAPEYEAVVLAGDLLSIAAPVAVEAQIVAIRATLRRLATMTTVIACSGNHDLNALNAAGEKTADWFDGLAEDGVVTDGQSTIVGDAQISVLPWWDGPVARAESVDFLAGVDRGAARRWLWVYHSPPQSLLSWTGARHFGDPTVAEWIEKWRPDAVLCGHIHQAPFAPDGSWVDRIGQTWVFNPGKQTGPVPACIELDFDGAAARWTSMVGAEDRALTAS
ncbi:MAG: metallophosphoesterase family protein [Sporichthyaceae bacterium]|jgi:Icc-related predicted phosphoesterase